MTKRIQEQRRQYRASIPGAGKASYQKKYDKAMSGRDPKAAIGGQVPRLHALATHPDHGMPDPLLSLVALSAVHRRNAAGDACALEEAQETESPHILHRPPPSAGEVFTLNAGRRHRFTWSGSSCRRGPLGRPEPAFPPPDWANCCPSPSSCRWASACCPELDPANCYRPAVHPAPSAA